MTPYEATRALLESLSVIALEQLMQELEGEDPLPEEAYAPFQSLAWEELDILRRGGITIGSHTKSHVLMTRENGDRLQDELTGSRKDLERRLATNIDHIAYPSGMWDTNSLEAVAAAGYRFGFSGCTHRDARRPSLTIPRVMLWQNACLDSRGAFSEAVLSCQVHRALDLVSGCRQRHESRNVA
jgi:peptidoglycan/xylan/chitin deacetylase (PgdA/CDA1 family)